MGSSFCRPPKPPPLIPPPLTEVMPSRHCDGEIRVIPPRVAKRPVCVVWHDDAASAKTSVDTTRAHGLPPGMYTLSLQDATGARSHPITVHVPSTEVPTVVGYTHRDTSSDHSRDGEVTALLSNVGEDDDAELLWTGAAAGIGTSYGRSLKGIPCGVYSAVIVRVNSVPVHSLHACDAVRVRVRSISP